VITATLPKHYIIKTERKHWKTQQSWIIWV